MSLIKTTHPPSLFTEKYSDDSGFTLLEVLISVGILGIGLTAIFAVFNTNIKSASLVRNNYIAAGLVQEGIEVIRNLRDSDWLAGRAFGSFGGSSPADGTYSVEAQSMVLGTNQNVALKKSSSGFYNYSSGNDTIFRRSVSLVTVVANVEKKITVTVSWTERGQAKSVSAESHLYNWYTP